MQQDHIEIKEVQFANAVLLPEIVKMLDEGHTVTLRLRGYSMRPFLEDNRDKALPEGGRPCVGRSRSEAFRVASHRED